MTSLPTNIEASYLDRGPGDGAHHQHHDILHGEVNLITTGTVPAPLQTTLDARFGPGGTLDNISATDAAALADAAETASSPRTALYLPGTSGNYVSCPDTPLGTADLEVIALVAADDWTPAAAMAVAAQVNAAGSFFVQINTNGTINFRVYNAASANRTATFTAPAATNGVPLWLRFTFDADNGAAGSTARMYTAAYDGTNTVPTAWTQNDTDKTVATAWVLRDSSDPIEIGSHTAGTLASFAGEVYRVQIASTIGGTPVVDYRSDTPAVRYRDPYGNVFTVAGAGTAWVFPT